MDKQDNYWIDQTKKQLDEASVTLGELTGRDDDLDATIEDILDDLDAVIKRVLALKDFD